MGTWPCANGYKGAIYDTCLVHYFEQKVTTSKKEKGINDGKKKTILYIGGPLWGTIEK